MREIFLLSFSIFSFENCQFRNTDQRRRTDSRASPGSTLQIIWLFHRLFVPIPRRRFKNCSCRRRSLLFRKNLKRHLVLDIPFRPVDERSALLRKFVSGYKMKTFCQGKLTGRHAEQCPSHLTYYFPRNLIHFPKFAEKVPMRQERMPALLDFLRADIEPLLLVVLRTAFAVPVA